MTRAAATTAGAARITGRDSVSPSARAAAAPKIGSRVRTTAEVVASVRA
jgi:hypothetical protein